MGSAHFYYGGIFYVFSKLARAGVGVAVLVLANTALAPAETSATPVANAVAQVSPAPSTTPNPFSYKGYLRGYYFTRQNASGYKSGVNQASLSAALDLHGDYKFQNSGFSVGATYLYSNPLNNCADPASHFSPPCGKVKAPALNPDDTLPGFSLSTLYEAYVQYQSHTTAVKVGDQVINTPWANASDSRLKPEAFQGADLSYKFNHDWTGELSYYNAFENRVSSQFFRSTLLTYNPADAPGQSSLVNVSGSNGQSMTTNNGFFYGRLGYANGSNVVANAHYYAFSDIANLLWLDGKYTLKGNLKPYVAAQFGNEMNAGSSLVGKISAQVFGIAGGLSVTPNVTVTLGYNDIPSKSATVALPTGLSCQSTAGKINTLPTNVGAADYYLANGGPNCVAQPSVGGVNYATVYYGGIASPYTDSYATDPLFTSSISQGMVDRRTFGQAGKLAVGFVSDNKRFVATIARALYAYGNNAIGVEPTQETNIDAMYYFSAVPKAGAYKGFLIRHRYAERTIANTALYGGLPLFKYNRTQFEYDF